MEHIRVTLFVIGHTWTVNCVVRDKSGSCSLSRRYWQATPWHVRNKGVLKEATLLQVRTWRRQMLRNGFANGRAGSTYTR
jgi:hypothetical protein